MPVKVTAFRVLVVFVVTIGLAACGFRLAGTSSLPQNLSSMILATSNLDQRQQDALRRQLTRAGAELKSQDDPEAVRLNITFNALPDRRLVTSARDGKSVERLTRSLDFSLSSAGGEVLVPTRTLTKQNDIVLDENNLLASSRERDSVLVDLEQALFEQLIRQLNRI